MTIGRNTRPQCNQKEHRGHGNQGEQDHDDEKEHKTTIIRRNTKTTMIRRDITPRQSWRSQDHGDEEEHKIKTIRRKTMVSTRPQGLGEQKLMSRICSNWSAPSFGGLQAWKHNWLETIDKISEENEKPHAHGF